MNPAFLRNPPFPGHRAPALAISGGAPLDRATAAELLRLLRSERVGGSFWAARPPLPPGRDILLAPTTTAQAGEMIAAARDEQLLDRCVMLDRPRGVAAGVPALGEPVDPWHLAQTASIIWADADHELALVAAVSGTSVRAFGHGRFAECAGGEEELVRAVAECLGSWSYRSPFGGDPIGPADAIRLLSDWRKLIDRNRALGGVFGVAQWKRPTVDPLLWDGSARLLHLNQPPSGPETKTVAIWKSRTPRPLLDRLERSSIRLVEIEDGMIRGPGLGANCVPPLSIVVDHGGIYFDPSQPSDLEALLQSAEIDDKLIDRAARLRRKIVEAGISKYGGGNPRERLLRSKRQILVAGQVEDDRSILSGGAGQTNLELLERARSIEPDAWLIYRPHPDVEAGHRKGHVPDEAALRFADEVECGGSIIDLIEAVDAVHCITSLAGFEALLRGKPVTTHGIPFYAGWGLTRDLADIPERRGRKRSLDELVAAALILYPRYLDPVSRLPCPPEVLVDRIASGEASVSAPLAGMRVLQGKLKIALRRLREPAA